MNEQLIPLIPALPIFGFAFTALLGRRIGRFAFLLPLLLVIASWAIAMGVVYTQLTGGYGEAGANVRLWEWIPAGAFRIDIGFHVDNLTACLLIVVTTIGMLVHLYSVGYMSHDGARWRFFAYLNLFMFSMLLLVLADNFLVIFAAWELVGLSSYSLIGFWYVRPAAALASKKAFIVNRVGDVGFALGIMALWVALGTLNVAEVNERIGTLDGPFITLIALLLFCGAAGKSA
jgi:NADH-quinone oxidoreductase subunit L